MALISATIFTLILLACILHLLLCKIKAKNLPPGPKGFPIIGSIHLLKKLVHRDLQKLSQTYGPIMHMKLGFKSTIIISSPTIAKLFLKTHDPIFASRPISHTSNQMSFNRKDIAFAQFGPYWHNMRKICSFQLLTSLKIDSFSSIRRQELGLLIDRLREAAKNHSIVDLNSQVSSLIAGVICVMLFGKKFVDEEFMAAIHEVTFLAGALNLGDFIPFIAFLDLQGLGRRSKAISKAFDGFLNTIIEQHVEFKDQNNTKSGLFVDVMLDLMRSEKTKCQIDRTSIKGVMFDLIVGGVDSTSTIINWALSELIKHPQVMKKVQKELEEVVGLNRMVEESDLNQLKYLDMVIKETFRMHPPITLIPRKSTEDCNVNGYHIPKNTHTLINAWAIGQDPSTWFQSHKFFPERFVDSQIDIKGKNFEMIPFGYGRRSCPGMQLAMTLVRLIVAQLVHCFDWKLPNGALPSELDMTEEFGLTCPRAQNLRLIPTFQLTSSISSKTKSSHREPKIKPF
ncbi:cytochrome P450 71AU50-like [Benincasa hispida]|uniref:cytochrome P450 71AU50-like n=1 Tax=Benincasa hispida TaxID=102211 RepID=UPI0019025D0B|nr:cytochrome P450 71AU50-like [Benincasa hispida]